MLWRIFTENKNQEQIAQIVAKYFHGFTLVPALGYWRGKPESSLVIYIQAHELDNQIINQIAQDIKELNKQESVLIVGSYVAHTWEA